MCRKAAIVLHGPPGTGKSTISAELRRRLSARHISLDEGWMPGDFRHRGGPGRYSDLVAATEAVLLIELGCGEPLDFSFPGATKGAPEWIALLRQAGREVIGFRLLAEPSDAAARIEDRINGLIQQGQITPNDRLGVLWNFLGLHTLYSAGHPSATFPPISGFMETDIMTTGRTASEVADQIMAATGLS